IKARIKQKLEQVSPTDGTVPAYIVVSCYAPKLYNPKMVKSCGVGILPARPIQIKYTTVTLHCAIAPSNPISNRS
ncbi:MAG: hypothetical protein ACKPJ4_13140, partial [Dolichospermum sp.]